MKYSFNNYELFEYLLLRLRLKDQNLDVSNRNSFSFSTFLRS
jgi:hypothetical protein